MQYKSKREREIIYAFMLIDNLIIYLFFVLLSKNIKFVYHMSKTIYKLYSVYNLKFHTLRKYSQKVSALSKNRHI